MRARGELRNIIKSVRSLTKYGIRVEPEPGLFADAYVKYFPTNGEFVITYNPEHRDELNYLIAHECGHLLRFNLAPPDERKVPYYSLNNKKKAIFQLADDYAEMLLRRIPSDFLVDSFDDIYTSAVRQLVTLPSDARIDRWIFTSCKGLRNVQQKSLIRLIGQCACTLNPEIKSFSPPSIYRACNAMNYAYTKFINTFLPCGPVLFLYSGTDYESLGKKLLESLLEEDTGYPGDRKTTDAWASILGLEGWYEWREVEEIQKLCENKLNNQQDGKNIF